MDYAHFELPNRPGDVLRTCCETRLQTGHLLSRYRSVVWTIASRIKGQDGLGMVAHSPLLRLYRHFAASAQDGEQVRDVLS
jgi:hypothetical protein